MGKSENGLALVEPIGPSENLVEAAIVVGLPNDNPDAVTENAAYTLLLLVSAVPDWEEGPDWLVASFNELMGKDKLTKNLDRNRQVVLQSFTSIGMVSLTVKVRD